MSENRLICCKHCVHKDMRRGPPHRLLFCRVLREYRDPERLRECEQYTPEETAPTLAQQLGIAMWPARAAR